MLFRGDVAIFPSDGTVMGISGVRDPITGRFADVRRPRSGVVNHKRLIGRYPTRTEDPIELEIDLLV